MKSSTFPFIIQALLAAVFFGASAPIAKLLPGDTAPIFLAAMAYDGARQNIVLYDEALGFGMESIGWKNIQSTFRLIWKAKWVKTNRVSNSS